VRELFAYIKSLERIAGIEKMGELHEYLVSQILYNPHSKPDLAEEYKNRIIRQGLF
jgi:hypothetical protein